MTRPFSSNLPLFCAQGKTYSFSLGNFAWDGFLAVAPQGRSGEKRFHSNAGAAVGALLVSPPRGGHPGKWEEDRPRIECLGVVRSNRMGQRRSGTGAIRPSKRTNPIDGGSWGRRERPRRDHFWPGNWVPRKSKGPSEDLKSKPNSRENTMGERKRGTFHVEAWENWVYSDPSVLRPSSPSPPAWPDLSITPSLGAQAGGPSAEQRCAEWGWRCAGSDQQTDLNGADGSGGQRLQVLRVQEVAGVSAQHLQDPDRKPIRLA